MNKTRIQSHETFLLPLRQRIHPTRLTDNDSKLHEFLSFHGYLQPGIDVHDALVELQHRHNAPATGNLNYQTCRILNSCRCTHPELTRPIEIERSLFDLSSISAPRLVRSEGLVEAEIHVDTDVGVNHEYEFVRGRWKSTTLGYALVGAAPSGLGAGAWDAIRSAFTTWTSQTILTFVERHDPARAEIRVLWTPGPASDSNSTDPFYGPGGKVAVGYYPFFFLEELAGDLHFDTSESWVINGNGLDIETIAVHEIGHCIGIGHSRNIASAMYSMYKTRQRNLTEDDVAEVARHYVGVG